MEKRDELIAMDKSRSGDLYRRIQNGELFLSPPCPSRGAFLSVCRQRKPPSPDAWYLPRVFVWLPHITFDFVHLRCKCGGDAIPKAWPEKPRKVYDVDTVYYVFAKQYRCRDCNSKFMGYDKSILAQCPPFVQEEFPCFFTHRSGVDLKLLRLLASCSDIGVGPATFRTLIREFYTARHTRLERSYYSVVEKILDMQSTQPTALQFIITNPDEDVPKFSPFDDKKGYNGVVPSGINDPSNRTDPFCTKVTALTV